MCALCASAGLARHVSPHPPVVSTQGDLVAAEMLLQHCADIKQTDDRGWTVLHYAIEHQTHAVPWLLSSGCGCLTLVAGRVTEHGPMTPYQLAIVREQFSQAHFEALESATLAAMTKSGTSET